MAGKVESRIKYLRSQAGDIVLSTVGHVLDPTALANKAKPRPDEQSVHQVGDICYVISNQPQVDIGVILIRKGNSERNAPQVVHERRRHHKQPRDVD